jgi:hypothetical protein
MFLQYQLFYPLPAVGVDADDVAFVVAVVAAAAVVVAAVEPAVAAVEPVAAAADVVVVVASFFAGVIAAGFEEVYL